MADPLELLSQLFATQFHRITTQALLTTALDLIPDQLRLLQELSHLRPHQFIKVFHTNRPTAAGRIDQMSIAVRSQATIILGLARGGAGRGPVEGIATLP